MNLIKWSIFAYLIKFLIFFLIFELILGLKGVAIHPHGDTDSYFNPIIDFFQTGIYNSNYRMPGYGLLLGIFLKPILAAVIPLAYAYLLSKKVKALFFILAILPPFLIEGAWIVNNYKKSGELIPFTNRNFYNEGEFGHLYGAKSLETLVRAYGGSHEYWKINSDISWYYFGGVAEAKMIQNMPYPNFNEVIQRSPLVKYLHQDLTLTL
jgi:hypothetical protein